VDDLDVPHGGTARLLGLVIAGLAAAALFGLVPSLDLSIKLAGIALTVTGYLACVVIPQLHRRINGLERRLAARVDSQERRLLAIEEKQQHLGAGAGEPLQVQR
jgi:hypothetical protein